MFSSFEMALTTIGRVIRAMVRRVKHSSNPVKAARQIGVLVGERCRFIGTSDATFGSEPYLVSIGDHVTVTDGVRFVTHDGGVWVLRDEHPDIDVIAPITVGSNVFIGLEALIMPGVTIGDNVIIAARSVVTRSVPKGSVVAGVPARVIGTIADYRKTSVQRSARTKGMSAAEKESFLRERFHR